MAPPKDKWVRRFVISETSRHKKGFTIYKVTSVMFLKTSPDVVSKVSVWKRYSDFKKLYSSIQSLHSTFQIKESLPPFPKPKFFGRFEAEVIEERRECALRFLEFIGQYKALFSSDVFVKFFESDSFDKRFLECSHSMSSDTSEDDRNGSCENGENTISSTTNLPKFVCIKKMTPVKIDNQKGDKSNNSKACNSKISLDTNLKEYMFVDIKNTGAENNLNEVINGIEALSCEDNEYNVNSVNKSSVVIHDGSDLTQCVGESAQYMLIAAAHMSAAFRHEAIAEYEEAFTQYKLGTSHLINGCQTESDTNTKKILQEKIKKYLQRAERLYNRHLNCNVSALHKPITELKNYKVIMLIESVMLVKDVLQEFKRIIKTVEKVAGCKKDISSYILRGKVPYMVQLYSCMQTDSTVFLVLQYMSRGKMWDFAKSHYKPDKKIHLEKKRHSRSFSCDAAIQSDSLVKLKQVNLPVIQITGVETLSSQITENERSSPTNKSTSGDVTELVKNAQKLLQSVNNTLKQSNSIASRLNESERLLYKTKVSKEIEGNICDWDSALKINSLFLENNEDTETSEDLSELSVSGSWTNLNYDRSDESSIQLNQEFKKESATINGSFIKINDSNFINTSLSKSISEIEECVCSSNENVSSDDENKMWTIPESTVKLWAAQILLALEALHQQDVIISDLRPDNILIDDFYNVSMTYMVPRKDAELLRLKRPYSSPELCMLIPPISITTSADVWSFGVILYELLTGFDFESKHPGYFHSHSLVNIPDYLSNSAKSLLLNILQFRPSDRMTIPEIKQDSFFSDIDWLELLNAEV